MYTSFSGFGRVGLAALLSLAALSVAEEAQAQSTDVNIAYKYGYLLPRGVMLHDGWVMQAGVKTKFYEPCYGGIWASLSLDEWVVNEDYGDELNYLAGCSGKVGSLEIDVGATYLDYISLMSTDNGDVVQLHAQVDFPLDQLRKLKFVVTPYARVEYALPFNWDVPSNDGALIHGGGRADIFVTSAIEFAFRMALVYDTGTLAGYDNGLLANTGAGLNVHHEDWLTFNAINGFMTLPFTDFSDGRDPEVAVGSGLQLKL